MSEKLGTIQFEGNQSVFVGRQYGQSAHYSEQVAYEIDLEIRRIMKEAYDEAHRIILEHRTQLNTIAEKLLEVETLDKRQIKALFETGQMPEEFDSQEEAPVEPKSFEEVKQELNEEKNESQRKSNNGGERGPLNQDEVEGQGPDTIPLPENIDEMNH